MLRRSGPSPLALPASADDVFLYVCRNADLLFKNKDASYRVMALCKWEAVKDALTAPPVVAATHLEPIDESVSPASKEEAQEGVRQGVERDAAYRPHTHIAFHHSCRRVLMPVSTHS